ncbi:MAG: hypothetical protein KDC87_12165, partial [Planctomycetes bacterium]|nr:hypothetical protein [Planctomycetota bacterium]
MNDRRGMMLVVVALLFPLGLTWAYFVAMDGRAPGQQQAVYAIGKVIQFGLPLLGMWLLGRPPGRRGERGWMRSGVAFGVVVAVVMLACYHLWLRPVGVFDGPAVAVRAKLAGMGVRTVPVFVAVALGYSLVHSLLEEYYWRWFVF